MGKKNYTAKQLLLKAKFYRIFGIVFACMGLFVFTMIFINIYKGDVHRAIREPAAILIVILPFLPSLVLSFIASSAEKQANEKLEKLSQGA